MKKQLIPKSLRKEVWLNSFGKVYDHKCSIEWCTNTIDVFNFECGHNIPESKNGETTIKNLVAICSLCNKSMGNKYTIDQFIEGGNNLLQPTQKKTNFFLIIKKYFCM
jgi:5-methylcytosine-specific restriction endonuclease McrA